MIAVTNSSVERSWTERSAAIAGITVRYGRSEKPSTVQATTQPTRQDGLGRRLVEDGEVLDDQDDPDQAAERGPEDSDASGSRTGLCGSDPPGDEAGPPVGTGTSAGAAVSLAPAGRRAPPRSERPPRVPRARRAGPPRGRSDGIAEGAGRDDLEALDRGHAVRAGRATIARSKPRRAASRSRRSSAGDRPELAEEADLANGDGARRDRPVAERRGEGQGQRQVEARLGDREAAGRFA